MVLDLDSAEIPVYGEQENSAYNGHFRSTCYHPLLLFNREGDCLAAKLRSGNVHSAEDWEELLQPEIEGQQKLGKEVVFRADAAFAKPEIYEALEERGAKHAIHIPSNDSLERDIAELLTRPVGKTEPQAGGLVQELSLPGRELEDGAAGGSQGKVSLLGQPWRRLVLPRRIENWSLTSLQQRLVKTGGRLVKHARYYWLLLAESGLTRRLFGAMVRRIAALPTG